MVNTVAFQGLMDLISFIGSFVTANLFFGISFIQLLVICYCVHYVIGICLGGIAPISPLERKQNTLFAKSIEPNNFSDRYKTK